MSSTTEHKTHWTWARRIVQFGVLVLFCLPLMVAGWGLFGQFVGGEEMSATPANDLFYGSLSSSSVRDVVLLDPYATLEIAAASKSFDIAWLAGALLVLLVYTLIRARAFCGWVCPVNLVLEGVDWLRAKLGIKVAERAIPRHAKIVIAAVVLVLSAVLSIPLFEAFSPISAINKGLLFGSVVGTTTLIAIIIAELFWARRVWCRALCPLGGFYQCFGRVGLVKVSIDKDACINCDACKKVCLADPVILEPVVDGDDARVSAGDCMACGACVDVCPTRALSLGVRPKKQVPNNARSNARSDT